MNREIKFRAWDKRFKKMDYASPMAILNIEDNDHEIMQYTGLKDKNGKEIYEGDIVTDGVGKYKIIYDLKLAGYQPYCIFRDDPENYCEIIGNSYENPELLEKKFAD